MKSFCCLILLFGTSLSTTFPQSQSNAFRVYLSLDSPVFVESETIWAHVLIKNVSTQPQRIPYSALDEGTGIKFVINDAAGEHVQHGGSISTYANESMVIVPGDSVVQYCELVYYFANKTDPSYSAYLASKNFIRDGSYKIKATIRMGNHKITSNTIQFKVRKPNQVESEALKILGKCDEIPIQNPDARIEAYKSFIKRYPNSPYGPYAYWRTIVLESIVAKSRDTRLSTMKSLVNAFPNSGVAAHEINGLVSLLADEQKSVELERIISTFPSTRVSRQASYILRQSSKGNKSN